MFWGIGDKNDYMVEYNGELLGIAKEPEAAIPGYLNILMLLSSKLDDVVFQKGDPGSFPARLGATSYAAGMALQKDVKGEGKTLGEVAEELSPQQFLAHIRGREDLIPVLCLGPSVWKVMEPRAEFLQAQTEATNIVYVNFNRQ